MLQICLKEVDKWFTKYVSVIRVDQSPSNAAVLGSLKRIQELYSVAVGGREIPVHHPSFI